MVLLQLDFGIREILIRLTDATGALLDEQRVGQDQGQMLVRRSC